MLTPTAGRIAFIGRALVVFVGRSQGRGHVKEDEA